MPRRSSTRTILAATLALSVTAWPSRATQGAVTAIAVAVGALAVSAQRRDLDAARARARDLDAQRSASDAALTCALDASPDACWRCDLDGRVRGAPSRAALARFGPAPPDARVWDLVGDDRDHREALRERFAAAADPARPLRRDALRLRRDDDAHDVALRRVFVGERLTEVLVLARDVTATTSRDDDARRLRELPEVAGHAASNRRGFERFVAEGEVLLESLAGAADAPVRRRILHTLAGAAAARGLAGFAARCDAHERRLGDDPDALPAARVEALRAAWARDLAPVRAMLSRVERGAVRIGGEEHEAFVDAMLDRGVDLDLVDRARAWPCETVAQVLAPLAAQAERLAAELGKRLRVVTDDHGLRMTDETLRAFVSNLAHVYRNAAVHGVEAPEARAAAGKRPEGVLRVEVWRDAWGTHFELGDDGDGVDWVAVREEALARGLPTESRADLERAIFADDVSTAARATDLAGRGVGMASLRAACLALGGVITVRSERGRGATFAFDIPSRASRPTASLRSLSARR